MKVRAVVNCCEFDNRRDVPGHFSYYHINVPDYGVPTDAQIEQFLEIMDHRHEQGKQFDPLRPGCGHTGQFIVAWCARAGFIPKSTDPVERIRARRKCCLETDEQINCVRRLAEKLR